MAGVLSGAIIIGLFFYFYFKPSQTVPAISNMPSVQNTKSVDVQNILKEEKYPYLNKTKIYELGKHYIINFSDLKKSLTAIQKKYPQKTFMYFDYLNNGSWVGLGERDEFTAASLVKVPLAMAVYKAIEDGRLTPAQSYTLDELDLDSDFGDLYKVGPDNSFTIEELAHIMLGQSDNTARTALYKALSRIGITDPLADVYSSLGWEFAPPLLSGNQNTDPNYYNAISLKVLSNMFLALYNATYVNLDHSQKILGFLASTAFNDKIRAGVPDDVPVAHKIGTAGMENTFSDCGIVYALNRHYILCAGSSGADEKTAAAFMAEASAAAYKFVINN